MSAGASSSEATAARTAAAAAGLARVVDRAGRVLVLGAGAGLLALAARLVLRASGEPTLDVTGSWADDGWARASSAAICRRSFSPAPTS